MLIQRSTRHIGDSQGLVIRPPNAEDASEIHDLIAHCPPIELNSCYAYLLLSTHFRATSAVALSNDNITAFLGAYLIPERSNTLFVWQVAVHSMIRGKGVGQLMLESLLNREALGGLEYIEATVAPSNVASLALFRRFAWHHGSAFQVTGHFDRHLFGSEEHEEERLIRIGPMQPPHRS